METLTLKKIDLKDTVRKALDPFEFELEMHCKEDLEEKVIFTIFYTVNVSNENEDQVLSETEIFPIPKGNIKFTLEADAPDIKVIPYDQLFGLTSIIIVGKYKEEQFIRIGYIVDVYYPGIPNDKLLYNDDDAEDINDEDMEEEEDENGNLEDLVVEDEECEEKKIVENINESCSQDEEDDTPRSFTDAMVEKVTNNEMSNSDEIQPEEFNQVNEELEKTITEEKNQEDVFEYKGHKINYNFIELNVMVPPSIHTFLIQWKNEQNDLSTEEEVSKKIKREE